VHRLLANEFNNITPVLALDYKTLLQETLQAEKKAAPKYQVTNTEGPPHQRKFFVDVTWDGGKVSGQGLSIKTAEMMAAKMALEKLGGKPGEELSEEPKK